MKRILITGKNSYVGSKFMEWVSQWPDEYQVDAISVRCDEWKQHDFSGYDSVLHVAGIAHIKETKENHDLYYHVNRDLAYEVAVKSKNARIPHFIFLSSMSIFGLETGIIDKKTIPKPKSAYGKSKYEAEKLINELQDEQFKVAIVRPPMIYGPGCPGNYAKLSKLAKITPIFPKFENQRSMIFVDNLCSFILKIINYSSADQYHPQNAQLVNVSNLMKAISNENRGNLILIPIFLKGINSIPLNIIKKIFGNLSYSIKDSNLIEDIDFKESIKLSERI